MSGRYEREQYLDSTIRIGLTGYPQIFINYYEESAGTQKTTKKNFINTVKRFVDYLDEHGIDVHNDENWGKVTKRKIKDYFKTIRTVERSDGTIKELKGKTLNDYLIAINNFFDYLVSEEVIKVNPCPTKKEMRGIFPEEMDEREVTYLTLDEFATVKEKIQTESAYPARDLCWFVLGCRTGLRAQALSEIDINDIDFESKTLYVVEKHKKIRTIYLDDDSIILIKECINEKKHHREYNDLQCLFCRTYQGKPCRISVKCIELLISKYTSHLDKHITPHKMRSTCITITYKVTGDVFAAARRAGHSNIQNTKRYINTVDEDKKLADQIASVL